MLKAIALFFPALMSCSIYARRSAVELKFTLSMLIRYGIYVMLINWCNISLITYIFRIEDNILVSMDSGGFFTKYVLFAMLFAGLIPYIEEIIRKSIHIDFQIKPKADEK